MKANLGKQAAHATGIPHGDRRTIKAATQGLTKSYFHMEDFKPL